MPYEARVTQMPDLTRVAVVRPKLNGGEKAARFILAAGFTFLNGLFLMLIIPAVTSWHPNYWQSVLVLVGLRILQNGSGWINWTHAPASKS